LRQVLGRAAGPDLDFTTGLGIADLDYTTGPDLDFTTGLGIFKKSPGNRFGQFNRKRPGLFLEPKKFLRAGFLNTFYLFLNSF